MTELQRRYDALRRQRTAHGATLAELTTLDDLWTRDDPVLTELARARRLYPPMKSLEEGMWVIQEEWEELKAETYRKPAQRDYAAMREELVQLEAMCRRLREDVVEPVLARQP